MVECKHPFECESQSKINTGSKLVRGLIKSRDQDFSQRNVGSGTWCTIACTLPEHGVKFLKRADVAFTVVTPLLVHPSLEIEEVADFADSKIWEDIKLFAGKI
jgi:hypothetical protein